VDVMSWTAWTTILYSQEAISTPQLIAASPHTNYRTVIKELSWWKLMSAAATVMMQQWIVAALSVSSLKHSAWSKFVHHVDSTLLICYLLNCKLFVISNWWSLDIICRDILVFTFFNLFSCQVTGLPCLGALRCSWNLEWPNRQWLFYTLSKKNRKFFQHKRTKCI